MCKNPYDILQDTELEVEEDRPPGDTIESTAWGDGISSISSNSSKTSFATGHRNKQKKNEEKCNHQGNGSGHRNSKCQFTGR